MPESPPAMSAVRGLHPMARRILQAVLYEGIAIALVAPVLSLVFAEPAGSTLMLTVLMSTTALVWNYAFNAAFERWESRQAVRGRSARRRLVHGLGFEGGLALILVPLVAWWLSISWFDALLVDLAALVFFFFYTVGFTWLFDRIFGLPESAR